MNACKNKTNTDKEKTVITNENYKSYNDSIIEEMWQALDDVPFDEQANGKLILSEKWLSFEAGTAQDDIWRWFDKHYSKGVYELLYGDKKSFNDCTHSYEELCALFDKIVPLSNPQMSSKTIETLADKKVNQIGRAAKNNKER